MKAKISEIFVSIQGEGIFAGQKHLFVRFSGCQLACAWCDTEKFGQKDGDEVNALSVEEVGTRIQKLSCHCQAVSLTGGEPLLQADFIKELGEYLNRDFVLRNFSRQQITEEKVPAKSTASSKEIVKKSGGSSQIFLSNEKSGLKSVGIPILLETNGLLTDELKRVMPFIDIISMDFKLPSSTKGKAFWPEHEAFLTEAIQKNVYVKAVITLETALEDIQESAAIIKRINPEIPFILQPNHLQRGQEIIKKCMTFQQECLSSLSDVRILPQLHKILNVK